MTVYVNRATRMAPAPGQPARMETVREFVSEVLAISDRQLLVKDPQGRLFWANIVDVRVIEEGAEKAQEGKNGE